MELMQAAREFAFRPNDQRFNSLTDMQKHFDGLRSISAETRVNLATLEAVSSPENPSGLMLVGPSGNPFAMTHWSFNQLTKRLGIPTEYLGRLPGNLAASNVSHALQSLESSDDSKMLAYMRKLDDGAQVQAFTSPTYNRIYNKQITDALVGRYGDGVSGDWKVPGILKQALKEVNAGNTTLFASPQDMFVFLCDEEHRIEVPNRRNGENGSLSRGFFVWNSEVGASTFGVAFFYFDEVCANRIVWGAEGYTELKFRHTKNANDKWIDQLAPRLIEFANSKASPIEAQIKLAQETKVDDTEKFFAKFGIGPRTTKELILVHQNEESRPIETVWDAQVAVTAKAKANPFQNERVVLERVGGQILDLVANVKEAA